MDRSVHKMSTLFLQLGLRGSSEDIDNFIAQHGPIDASVSLADAVFWTAGQAQFIRESLESDGDWAELVDELDTLLR